MRYQISNKNLASAIDEIGEEYKDIVIEKLLSTSSFDIENMQVSDLLKIDSQIKQNIVNEKRIDRRNSIFTILTALGLMYNILGFVLVWNRDKFTVIKDRSLVLAIIIVIIVIFALMVAILFKIYPLKSYARKSESANIKFLILDQWKRLESYARSYSEDNLTLSKILYNLKDLKVIDNNDMENIRRLLNLRNNVIYSKNPLASFKNPYILKVLSDTDDIIKKLEKLEK
ncbi:hypothetical protein QA584_17385 [Anaerocolumna sp. AGMB13025]|uniref:hypothetical protein n=1 Tax=Anaerocolumna sp. AGMB13025 TaxID=3039116 RepID=UPI0024203563|nr:hypothetical protein [Anaerocolumna sp. AGMB13025]WFR55374.1 hypothetical protein QA584_17385 [Anaerocolumna sp. AGMB13025]